MRKLAGLRLITRAPNDEVGMSLQKLSRLALYVLMLVIAVPPVYGQGVTAEQRRELGKASRDIKSVASLVRRKKLDEAEAELTAIEEKLKGMKLPTTDRMVQGIARQIMLQKNLIARQRSGGKPVAQEVSFEKQIAPVLTQRCGSCHGANNPRGGLRLNTFAGLEAGGQGGPLLVVGNPNTSRIMQRLVSANPRQRMPQGNGGPLTPAQIQLIGRWIAEGAKYDGTDKTAAIGTSSTRPAVEIQMATGNETVSFTKDIAPFMVNLCMRCHSGNSPRSGFSLQTFEQLMQGGDSGRVVIAGNLEGSRLWDLVGKQDPIKMPPGQALITRTNWNNLRTWIEEGARFDGDDPKKALRDLVPTEAQMKAEELAKLSPEEFQQHRMRQTEELWKRVMGDKRAQYVESKEFLIFGDAGQDRLLQIDEWAEEQGAKLRQMFGQQNGQIWKGRLAVIVLNERFSYEEFNQVAMNRQTPQEVIGHAVVDASYDNAYVVLQDVGDDIDASNPGMRVSLTEQLASAYLMRGNSSLPAWVVRGVGLNMALQADPENLYLADLEDSAADAVKTVTNPTEVFDEGTFPPGQSAAVATALVKYMIESGGAPKFGRFIQAMQSGANPAAAAQSVYRANLTVLGTAFIAKMLK